MADNEAAPDADNPTTHYSEPDWWLPTDINQQLAELREMFLKPNVRVSAAHHTNPELVMYQMREKVDTLLFTINSKVAGLPILTDHICTDECSTTIPIIKYDERGDAPKPTVLLYMGKLVGEDKVYDPDLLGPDTEKPEMDDLDRDTNGAFKSAPGPVTMASPTDGVEPTPSVLSAVDPEAGNSKNPHAWNQPGLTGWDADEPDDEQPKLKLLGDAHQQPDPHAGHAHGGGICTTCGREEDLRLTSERVRQTFTMPDTVSITGPTGETRRYVWEPED